MENIDRAENRKRVKELFLDRLDQVGLQRPRKFTTAQHEDMQKRLSAYLGYLCDANLLTLAELVIDAGRGVFKLEWPPEAAIRSLATGLQSPPLIEHRIVSSWLASIEGPRAVAGGFEVELYQTLKLNRRPPNGYVMGQIRQKAQDNARRIEAVRDRIAREVATDEDRQWLEWYLRERAYVRSIIKDGQRQRENAA